ncbi:MAG TPA: hypothetical protein PKD85_15930 [Saprospiraceae bacterium]|nr:hypothetical protein [Saprospiraceae bacterium]
MKQFLLLFSLFLLTISCQNKESKVTTIKNEQELKFEITDSWDESSPKKEKFYTFAITDDKPFEITSDADNPVDVELINLRTNNVKLSFRGRKAFQSAQIPLDNYRLKVFPVEDVPTEFKFIIKGPKYQPIPMQ